MFEKVTIIRNGDKLIANTWDSYGDVIDVGLTPEESSFFSGFLDRAKQLRPAHELAVATAQAEVKQAEEAKLEAQQAKDVAIAEKETIAEQKRLAESAREIAENKVTQMEQAITSLAGLADLSTMSDEALAQITPLVKEWMPGGYKEGDIRREGGALYRVIYPVPDTETRPPSEVATAWQLIEAGQTVEDWQAGVTYHIGDLVTHNGKTWHCTKDATTEEPTATSSAWTEVQ